ncbi:MAG: late competence development ComFB family protein [Bacillota bacterium]
MELKNLMEMVVFHTIDDIKKYYDFCDCQQCRLDISAIALNKIPPRYVVSSKGESYGRAELLAMQKDLDVLGIVLDAVKFVQKKPRH